MLELLVFVAGSYILFRYMYPRKTFKAKRSQTEMQRINKSTQTDSDSDSMSVDLEMAIDELFFEIQLVFKK